MLPEICLPTTWTSSPLCGHHSQTDVPTGNTRLTSNQAGSTSSRIGSSWNSLFQAPLLVGEKEGLEESGLGRGTSSVSREKGYSPWETSHVATGIALLNQRSSSELSSHYLTLQGLQGVLPVTETLQGAGYTAHTQDPWGWFSRGRDKNPDTHYKCWF